MRALEITGNDYIEVDRFSRRMEEAVEIFERETIRMIKLKNDLDTNQTNVTSPKLVIDDALSATKVFIAKARSEASELDNILREVLGTNRHVR